MGRPLGGSLRFHRNRWWASVPEAPGATRRREERFVTEDDARAWLTQAVSALRAGATLPDPQRFRIAVPPARTKPAPAPKEPPPVLPDVASVAQAWMAAAYEDLRRGGPERAERVRRLVEGYLVPWFAPRTTTVADVTYPMAHEWLLHLIGREPGAAGRSILRAAAPVPPTSPARGAGEDLGLLEAAGACGVSLPTMRRRFHDGRLPGAYRNRKGQIRVPRATLRLVRAKTRPAAGLSQSYVADALWVLRRVLAFARANGLFPPGFDPTESLEAPAPDPAAARARRPRSQPRPLTLPECARIAGHLHAVHQMVFWLQRIMGLRISEAFGVLVADVVDLGANGLLAAQGQGGRTFSVRDDHGRVVAVPHKKTTKTAAGMRVLVVPEAVMALVRVAVDAFHTDPDSGEVDTTARLVPGVLRANQAGGLAYHRALEEATRAEGLGSADLGFRVSSHLLRKSVATDLAWQAGIEDPIRRRFMGHRAGDDVYGRIYTLDHPEVAPLAKVAAFLDDQIAATIGTLLTPTIRRVHWGAENPLAARAAHVDATLAAAGWQVDPGRPDDPLCDTERVAAELGLALSSTRRCMADGTLPAVVAPDAAGVPRRYVRLSHVWAYRDRVAGRILLPDVAEQLGLRYHELYHMVRRLGLDVHQDPTSREYELTAEQTTRLRAEHERIVALHRRSMKLAAAARQLKVALSTISVLSRNGALCVDLETDSSGARFVTRASVEACWIARHAAKRRPAQPVAAVSIAEVTRFTGHSTAEIMDLVHAGVLEQIPGRRAVQLTAASLRAWMERRAQTGDADLVEASPLAADGTIVPLSGAHQ